MVANARKYFAFDRNTAFAEDLTLAASDVVAFGGTDVQLDFGDGYYEGVLVIDVSSIETASTDENYTFILEGGTVSGFGSGSIDTLAWKRLEHASSSGTVGAQNVTHTAGRYMLHFCNMIDEQMYRYVRLNVIIGGTIATGITFTAFIAPKSEC